MPLLMASDTRMVLGENAPLCESRSLLLDRLALARSDPKARRALEEQVFAKPALGFKLLAWRDLLLNQLPIKPEDLLFGGLQGRLLLHTQTGPLEQAGLCLDRHTGVPFIPGSAIKGCARDYAIELLRQASAQEVKVERLVETALVFGWSASDWHPDSDLAWACQPAAERVLALGQERLWRIFFPHEDFGLDRWRARLGRCRGQVHFLPAYPWELPGNDLELEVADSHHPSYYRSDKDYIDALDVEEPVPQFFPAVAPGILFTFIILGNSAWRPAARSWLQAGLATLGLGTKKSAGYGWFDTSEALQLTWQTKLSQQQQTERKRRQFERETQLRKEQVEAKRRADEAFTQAMEKMSPEEQEDFKMSRLTDDQFRSKLQNFARGLSAAEQLVVIRALRGPRLGFWEDLKQRARRGGQWAQVEQAIRAAAKKAGLGKMP
ncbi:MAG: type III-B CRISPR module RAMP protein Cmr6 [Candidatus Omnitrophica bacterium]|nr:type III-B CRISPR module RAMP protein Cmr6 [Candidatus Omnitrophota bacterium]